MTSPLFADGQLVDAAALNGLDTRITALVAALSPTVTALSTGTKFEPYPGFLAPGYYRVGRTVYLCGLVRARSAINSQDVIGNLPVGFRPSSTVLFPTLSTDTLGRIDVLTSGNVIAFTTTTSGGYFNLNGISFPV